MITPAKTVGLSCAALGGIALVAYLSTSKPAATAAAAAHNASAASAPRLSIAAADSMLGAADVGSAPAQVGSLGADGLSVADKIAAVDQHGGGSMEGAVAGLERRLATKGGSDADWELLAKSYEFLGRSSDAAQARNKHVAAGAAAAEARAAVDPTVPMALGGQVSVDGEVILADALRDKVPAGLTLFIVAKSVNSPGPPVAILRATTDAWPVHFRLDDTQAMMPQRKLSTAGPVTIEARTSKSGQAMPERGDFQGVTTQLDPSAGKPIRIVIERVIS